MSTNQHLTPKTLDNFRLKGLAIFCLTLTLAACSSGGGGDVVAPVAAADTDQDGIPDTVDAVPNDATKFVNNVTVPLAGLTPAGGGFTAATAVNRTGAVVGYSEDAAHDVKAVRWTVNAVDGSVTAPTSLVPVTGGGTYSAAYGVNNAGLAVGESEGPGGNFVATVWNVSGTPAALPASVTFPDAGRSAAHGVSNGSTPQIVGEASTVDGALRAVVWTGVAGTPVDLGVLPGGTFSSAVAISNDGLVVGEADTSTGVTHAVAWRVNASGAKTVGPVDLGIITVADVRSIALGVDSAGHVVGESEEQAGVVHAGLWTLDTATLVPTAKKDLGANGGANAINEVNRMVGHLTIGPDDRAAVWDTRNANLANGAVPETTANEALGVSDGNLVVGLAATATGASAFVAVPK